MSQNIRPDKGRRGFLKTLGLAGSAAGAALVAGQVQARTAAAAETETGREPSGYRETEHVRSYYDSARH